MGTSIRIDFHTHILPGMDDGCVDVDMSLAQLKLAADHKIDVVIATSHFYPHAESVESFLRRREDAWKRLQARRENVNPVVKLGAEVLICNGMEKMDGIKSLCVEHSNVLLVEMPFIYPWDSKLLQTVMKLKEEKGLEVILAHGERYPRKEIEPLMEQGFFIQLNVAATAKRIPSSFVKHSIKQGCVAGLGSDLHGKEDHYKQFTRSMLLWGEEAEWIMLKTEQLLKNKKNEVEEAKGGLSW